MRTVSLDLRKAMFDDETGEVVVTSAEPLSREAVEAAVGEAGYQLA